MKISFTAGLLVWGLALGLAWAGDSTDKKIGQDIQQLKKDYQKKVDKDLKEIGAKIRHLKHHALRAGDRLSADINKDVKELDAKKAEVDKKFAELKKSTGDAWKDLRRGVDDAVMNLRKSVDEAADRYKEKK